MKRGAGCIGRERTRNHCGTQIGAADTDIDDIGDLATGNGVSAGTHRLGKFAHCSHHLVDGGHHILAVDLDRFSGKITQCSMQDCPLLRRVDRFARKHRITARFDARRSRQFDEPRHDLGVDAVLRIVEEKILKMRGEVGET